MSEWPLTHCLPTQELCKQLHAKIDVAEEEKYDMEVKVQKSSKEVRGRSQWRGERGIWHGVESVACRVGQVI